MVDNRFCASPAFDVIFDQSAYIAFDSPVLILDFHKTVECPSIEPDTQLDAESPQMTPDVAEESYGRIAAPEFWFFPQSRDQRRRDQPSVFFATCARLIGPEVNLTIEQGLPGGLLLSSHSPIRP